MTVLATTAEASEKKKNVYQWKWQKARRDGDPEYHEMDNERVKACMRKYRSEDPEKYRAYNREYKKAYRLRRKQMLLEASPKA